MSRSRYPASGGFVDAVMSYFILTVAFLGIGFDVLGVSWMSESLLYIFVAAMMCYSFYSLVRSYVYREVRSL
jgi:hypothetical protein